MLEHQKDLLFHIFQYCDLSTHLTLSLVSRECHEIASSNRLWSVNLNYFCSHLANHLNRTEQVSMNRYVAVYTSLTGNNNNTNNTNNANNNNGMVNPTMQYRSSNSNRFNFSHLSHLNLSHLLYIDDKFQNFLPGVQNSAFGISASDRWIPITNHPNSIHSLDNHPMNMHYRNYHNGGSSSSSNSGHPHHQLMIHMASDDENDEEADVDGEEDNVDNENADDENVSEHSDDTFINNDSNNSVRRRKTTTRRRKRRAHSNEDSWHNYAMSVSDEDESNGIRYKDQLIDFLRRVKNYETRQFREREMVKVDTFFHHAKYYLSAFALSLLMLFGVVNMILWGLAVDNVVPYAYSMVAAFFCSCFIILIPIVYSMFMGVIPISSLFSRFFRCRMPQIEMDSTNYFTSVLMFHFTWVPCALLVVSLKILLFEQSVWNYILTPVYLLIAALLTVQVVCAARVTRENNVMIAQLDKGQVKVQTGFSKWKYKDYLRSVTTTVWLITSSLIVCDLALVLSAVLCSANTDLDMKWSYSTLMLPIYFAAVVQLILVLSSIRSVGTLGISFRAIRGMKLKSIFVYVRGVTFTYPLFCLTCAVFPFCLLLGLIADGEVKTMYTAAFSLLYIPLCCCSCLWFAAGSLLLYANPGCCYTSEGV